MRIVTRAEWGARPPKRAPYPITTPTPELWLHHAAGAILPEDLDDRVSTADLNRIGSIQTYHQDKRLWNDIAYSFLLDPDGNVFEGRGAGIAGGHTKGRNTVSHGICVMGNYDRQAVPDELIHRLADFIAYGANAGWWPDRLTGGHRDAPNASTSCPGRNLWPLIGEINHQALNQEEDPMRLPELDLTRVTRTRSSWVRGETVKTLQGLLVARGYAPANTIVDDEVDGVGGPGTRAATVRFQISRRLPGTALVDEDTWDHLVGLK